MDHGLQGYHEGITGRKPDIPEGITARTPRIPEHEGIILQCHKIHHYLTNQYITNNVCNDSFFRSHSHGKNGYNSLYHCKHSCDMLFHIPWNIS